MTGIDITETTAPKSDQLNADDLIAGPVTVTVSQVTRGNPEQPINVELVEYPGRPFRPSKSMRRVLLAGWGRDAATYSGHRLTLYRDPEVTFGREKVGGIRISHMSHIEAALDVPLTVRRGKRALFHVEPLPAAPAITAEMIAAVSDIEQLRGMWNSAPADMRPIIEARVKELA